MKKRYSIISRADQLAKLGCSGTDYFEPTEAYIRRFARAWLPRAVQGRWEKNASMKYRALGIEFSLKPNPELSLPRWLLGHLLAARTGHGDFAEYHERFNHTDYQADCVCGKTKDTHHIFHCRRVPIWLRVESRRISSSTAAHGGPQRKRQPQHATQPRAHSMTVDSPLQ